MRQRTLLALVGGVVFIGVAAATLPASLIVSRLPPDFVLEGVSGSIWSGGADSVRFRNAELGAASWSAEPLALLGGHLNYHVELARNDHFVRGRVGTSLGGTVTAEDLELNLPVDLLGGTNPTAGWLGGVAGTVHRLTLEHGWPVALEGALTFTKLEPPGSGVPIGDYRIDFDPPTGATANGGLVGRVKDVNAPLTVRAQLVIKRDRNFSLEGDVTPKPGAPPEVTQAIGFLGAPDAAGRRQFVLGGTI